MPWRAAALSYMQSGKAWTPVGVLLTIDNEEMLGGRPVFAEHVVSVYAVAAMLTSGGQRRPSHVCAKRDQNATYNERQGWHTFKALFHNPVPSELRKIEKRRFLLVVRAKIRSWQGLGHRIVECCLAQYMYVWSRNMWLQIEQPRYQLCM